eukprot:7376881-Prymnesium_polylepis.1
MYVCTFERSITSSKMVVSESILMVGFGASGSSIESCSRSARAFPWVSPLRLEVRRLPLRVSR